MELLFFFCTMIVLDHFFLTTEIQYLCFAWRVRVAVVLVDDDRVLDAAHDHVLERDVPGVPTSSLVGLDACSIARAVQLHRVDGDAGDFSS